MNKIFYWCPFISEVATVQSVINSTLSLKKFSRNKAIPYILNVADEWSPQINILKKNNIQIIDFKNKNLVKKLPKLGFISSRFSYLVIAIFSIFKLHKILKKEKPNFIIIHLISAIPLILLSFFNYKTKFILRVSGYPILSSIRVIFWRSLNKKLYAITVPTKQTLELLSNRNIFDKKKLTYLPDPAINIKEINKKKLVGDILEKNFTSENSLLSIGRLTKQKNYEFLVEGFMEVSKHYPNLNLFIIGDGENKDLLVRKIKNKKMENKIFLLGYKKNVFKYLQKCKFFILSSKYEDPGFVILEAGFMNKIVLSSNCPNGPMELIDNEKNGYLFKENSIKDFLNSFKRMIDDNNDTKLKKKINLKKKCKEFTLFNHYQKFKKILINEN
tara:strand:+ start:141 stop:1301 length:1161 start_codon:yes stop_codon:yes gene_type:complete